MKRVFDFFLSLILIIPISAITVIIGIMVKISSKGPILYWSDRIGENNKTFKMPKFRSMLVNTPAVATHLLDNPDSYLSHWRIFA